MTYILYQDSAGNPLGFYDGWRADQPSNTCVRQFGLEGWNDAICSRTWSGAQKDGVAMGHICETRIQEWSFILVEWIETFLAPPFPNLVARWNAKIDPFADEIRVSFSKF